MLTLPKKMQIFSKTLVHPDFTAWPHFFEEDCKYSKFRQHPGNYIEHLREFPGVISPDASIGWCDNLDIQKENANFNKYCYELFVEKGLNCIRNVRFGDARSYDFCFDGVPSNSILAVGSHGALRNADYRLVFEAGLDELCNRKTPRTLLIYGRTPDSIFHKYRSAGIIIIRFPSEFELTHRGVHGT